MFSYPLHPTFRGELEEFRPVSRFWVEKALVIIHVLQMYGLLWNLSQPWPWPAPWLKFTRWTAVFNLDFHSLREKGAGMGSTGGRFSVWGEHKDYAMYAIVWATVPYVLLFAEVVHTWLLRHFSRNHLRHRVAFSSATLAAQQLLFVPVGLAALRLLHCRQRAAVVDAAGTTEVGAAQVLDVDPHMMCWDSSHLLATCYCVGTFFLLGLHLIYQIYSSIRDGLITNDQVEHERYLQRREFEYTISINNQWAEAQFWLHSSFKRRASYFRVMTLLTKLLLLCLVGLLKGDVPTQGLLFFATVLVWMVFVWSSAPYRCSSSNQVARICSGILLFDTTMGMLKASGMRNAITTANSHAIYLLFGNAAGAGLLGLAIFNAFRRDQAKAFGRGKDRGGEDGAQLLPVHVDTAVVGRWHIFRDSPWPMGVHAVQAMLRSEMVRRWVETIHMAADFRAQTFDCGASLVALGTLDAHIGTLVQHRNEARKAASLIEDSLEEMIGEMRALKSE
jgi:hypothetical protein